VLELGSVPLPVVTARIDRFIAEGDVEACGQSGGGELDFFSANRESLRRAFGRE
jgi:hypothetical protein